jgi:predicted glycoside hydrolase/deacetylase ChbG (UPF0249 family)
MLYKGKVIVNADDFGENESINSAILKSFNLNLISSTTLMSNRPGFEEGCELARQNNLIDNIGVHLNLTLGEPLTEDIKKYPKFYANGEMYESFKGHILSIGEQRAIYDEFKAQIDKCRNGGINPTHIDSHHGIHYTWDIGKVIIELALKHGISAIRLRANWGQISKKRNTILNSLYNLRSKSYSNLYNYRIRKSGLAKTRYFCELINVTPELLSKDAYIEINSHPYMSTENVLVDLGHGSLLELEKRLLPVKHFITYKSIQK